MRQDQFLNVLDRDEAERRFRALLDLSPLPAETVPLSAALGRVLAEDIVAPVDVPFFDRANVDGFAVRAADSFGASEEHPRVLQLAGPTLTPGTAATSSVRGQTALPVSTGATVPRGADAVVMVEFTELLEGQVQVRRPVAPGANISFAGTDIGRGETVLRRGDFLTARETGVLAALGLADVRVVRRPRVAILSTGNELIPPGGTMRPGLVYDSNATVLADSVRELGADPVPLGIVSDDRKALRAALDRSLDCDVVLLSGGTSKGEGDLSYRAVAELGRPGVVAHGVALKPGKPLCLAVVAAEHLPPSGRERRPVPVAILPGFPTSAIFTFHEFLAPVIQRLGGRHERPTGTVLARLPQRVNSERGRTEYLLVGLVRDAGDEQLASEAPPFVAFPMGKGSGSVTAFSRADGFVIIPRQQEYVASDETVQVHLLGQQLEPADLVVIGSHCVGLDYLLGVLQKQGIRSKFLAVGSSAGLEATRRNECDLAGIHLLDAQSDRYNQPFLTGQILLPGYRRRQGFVYRRGDPRFEGHSAEEAIRRAVADPECVLINRNRGSGTRILLDQLLRGAQPPGYSAEARSHNAVAAAVAQGRADWGLAIANVACLEGLAFLPVRDEHFDFAVPAARRQRPAVRAFVDLLASKKTREVLARMGFRTNSPPENDHRATE
jgi:putative molybdopterin biosynthesis protein